MIIQVLYLFDFTVIFMDLHLKASVRGTKS